jgi:hypothetical protein
MLNRAKTLLEFLEQESDSNFGVILTLRKLRTSVTLERSKITLNNIFWRTFSRKIPDSRPYGER